MNNKLGDKKLVSSLMIRMKQKNIDKLLMLGIYCQLVYSKTIFLKNSIVAEFIHEVLEIDFPTYVVSSRTLMTARTIKIIYNFDDAEIEKLRRKTLHLLENTEIEENVKKSAKSSKKKTNENDKLESWLKGL